ncbi:winged helix-turn-helix domain-containing protein [Methanoregula sp.]|uniref:winged helix-turn-helix domain-containing protein n=1 Tax=Methanoregula sp. TaxID=2052170 RepID=UPI003C2A4C7C
MIVFVDHNLGANEGSFARIGHLPPSAKLVYKVLETNGQLTQKDLIRETALPSRTVRYALNRLKDEKFLIEHYYFIDARQSLYGLNTKPQEEVVAA